MKKIRKKIYINCYSDYNSVKKLIMKIVVDVSNDLYKSEKIGPNCRNKPYTCEMIASGILMRLDNNFIEELYFRIKFISKENPFVYFLYRKINKMFKFKMNLEEDVWDRIGNDIDILRPKVKKENKK